MSEQVLPRCVAERLGASGFRPKLANRRGELGSASRIVQQAGTHAVFEPRCNRAKGDDGAAGFHVVEQLDGKAAPAATAQQQHPGRKLQRANSREGPLGEHQVGEACGTVAGVVGRHHEGNLLVAAAPGGGVE